MTSKLIGALWCSAGFILSVHEGWVLLAALNGIGALCWVHDALEGEGS